MAKVCCIDGCSTAVGGTFFKFPNSRTLRRKWMDVITTKHNIKKMIDDSLICSLHFLEDQYEVIRGKTRLKAKVVPSLFVGPKSKSPEPSPIKSPKCNVDDSERNANITENVDSNNDTPTKPLDKDTDTIDTANDQLDAAKSQSKSLKPKRKKSIKENGDYVRKSQRIQDHTDLEINDIEDIITNYHIKQTIPNKIHSPENIEEPSATENSQNSNNGVIEINDEHSEPQFIEISADKGQNGQPDGQDCLMVLENVQVEIDPASMFPEYEEGDIDDNSNDSDVIDLGEKKNDPISLLTSSDEDEVIIEEPKIDTVEVSDATDEDDEDVPLVKLIKTKKKSKKSQKKGKKSLNLEHVMWGDYEYYCVQCHFTTHNGAEYKKHKKSHSTIRHFEVCQLCNYTTASVSQFIRHKRKHKLEKRYQCHLCEYKAKHHMSLLYHMKTHTAVAIDFEKCFRPDDKGDLIGRLKKYYKCDQCKYKSVRHSDLKRHRRKIHQDDDDVEDADYTPG